MNHERLKNHENGREDWLTGTVRPTSVRGFHEWAGEWYVGLDKGFLPQRSQKTQRDEDVSYPVDGKMKRGREQDGLATMGGTLWVGMSVPAHPPPCGELLLVRGYRGWLKPPTP